MSQEMKQIENLLKTSLETLKLKRILYFFLKKSTSIELVPFEGIFFRGELRTPNPKPLLKKSDTRSGRFQYGVWCMVDERICD